MDTYHNYQTEQSMSYWGEKVKGDILYYYIYIKLHNTHVHLDLWWPRNGWATGRGWEGLRKEQCARLHLQGAVCGWLPMSPTCAPEGGQCASREWTRAQVAPRTALRNPKAHSEASGQPTVLVMLLESFLDAEVT